MRKGNKFVADSPLSNKAKTFLSSFCDSELNLSYSSMNHTQINIFHAKDKYDYEKSNKLVKRLQKEWADKQGVELHTKLSWWTIVGGISPTGTYGRQPPTDWPDSPPAWDHATVWRCKHTKKPLIAVSQPYTWLLNKNINKLDQFADDYNFSFRISNDPSWYYPGRCWFIEWRQFGKFSGIAPAEG